MRERDLYNGEPLVAVTRGPVTECVHTGHVALVNGDGEILQALGKPDAVTYMRSAAKPFQAIPLFLSGAVERFQFSDAELAIMCASHYAEPHHLETVQGILEKVKLGPEHLKCGPAASLDPELAWKMAWENRPKAPVYNDCSGKHAGMLAVCVQNGWPLLGYTHPDHPVQRKIRRIMASVCGLMEDEIAVGVDGCAAPVFAMPLSAMGRAFARLANPNLVEEPFRSALMRIRDAMWAHPEMLAGTGGFCTALNRGGTGRVVGKLGAEGIYCMGFTGLDKGVALKINDGAFRAVWPSAVRILDDLELMSETLNGEVSPFREMDNRNDHGDTVGLVRPVFNL